MGKFGSLSVELKAVFVAALGSMCVGFTPFFAVGLQQSGMDTVSLLLWRYIVALVVLVPFAVGTHHLADEWRRGGRWLVVNALTLGTFQVYCYFSAIETMPTSVVVTIFYCYPILSLVLDRVLYGMPITAFALAAIATIISGVALTSLPELADATLDARGVMFACACAVGYALYIAIAYPFTRTVAPIASAVFIYGSFAITFGIAALIGGFHVPSRPDLWLGVLYIGTLGGALQILCFSYALPRLSSSGYSMIVCVEVVTVVLSGVLLIGESLIAAQWLGIALVLAGIVIARSRKRGTPSVAATVAPPPTAPAGEAQIASVRADGRPNP